MLPTNARLAKPEHVFFFNSMHTVCNIEADLRLQFTDKTLEHAHLDYGHESRLFQTPAVAGDRGEVVIDTGKTVIRPELSSMMVSSQFAPPCAGWLGLRHCVSSGVARFALSHKGRANARRK